MSDLTKPEHKLYEKFAELFPQFANGEYSYMKLEAGNAMMPLSLEWVFGNRISVMHTYELNGDLCYDPLMEFRFNNIGKTMSASMYEQSIPPIYQFFDDEYKGISVDGNGNSRTIPNLQSQLDDFASQWLDNIAQQGYVPVKAHLAIGEDNEVQITFDADGKPIMPEPDKVEKQYDINYAHFGNGLTVWNRLEEKYGDYVTIAHIGPDRTVTFYDEDMPDALKAEIERIAKTSDARVSATQRDQHVFDTPPETIAVVPDQQTTIAAMNNYGYLYNDMLPLSTSRAIEFFDTGYPIYLLYPDNSESIAVDRDEIRFHDGYCGIERDDWERSPFYAAQMAAAQNVQGSLETDLLYGNESKFGIYQIPYGIDQARDFRFVSMDDLEALGLSVDYANYKLVYTAPLAVGDAQTNLNNIFRDFNNGERPADFTGRSVSVGDVIVLQCNGDISSHFVDVFGFVELDSFLGVERQSSQTIETPHKNKESDGYSQVGNTSEEYTGPTVAKFESDVKAGKSISLIELSKAVHAERKPPTLSERLEAGKRKAAQHESQGKSKSKDTGVIT